MYKNTFLLLNAVWSTDSDGILGFLLEDHPGLLGIVPGQCLQDWMTQVSVEHESRCPAAFIPGQSFCVELDITASNGHAHRVLVTGLPQGTGTEVGYSGAIVDLTVHCRALDDALSKARQSSLIIEHSDDLIAHSGPDGRYLHVSPSYTRLMGWKPEQMVGRPVIEFLHPDDRASAHDALLYLVSPNARPLVTEVRKRNAVGEYAALATKACPVIDPVTGRSQGVVMVSRDITEEQAMRGQLRDLANEKLALVDSIDDGFFSVNAEWHITYVNQRAAAFVGATRDAVLGRRVWDVAPGLAESPIGVHLREAMATRESVSFEAFYEPNSVWLSERIYAYADGLSVFFHDISERKAAEAKLEELATRDSLTGLPNRAWINSRVDDMLKRTSQAGLATIFFIDLNRFKEINDSMGHATGDLLLQQVSERLCQCMRPGDVVARLGGDEFVVAASCTGREAATAIAQRLLGQLKAPFYADGLEMCVGASIGICLASPGVTTQQLFQSADTAMYKAKTSGTGGFAFYDPSMCVEAKRALTLEMALNKALELNEFEVYYQPRVDLRTKRILGLEALLRWNHPELGQISPLEFISLAEERGHIEAIGQWVLLQACHAVKMLNARFGLDLRMSVNVSARQLRSHSFVEQVLHALEASNVDPASIELEVTESALIVDLGQSGDMLRRLKQEGIRLSLDDFGTGYSSMSYLRQLPVDILKLDRSFVNQDASGFGFVAALVNMAHALGLSVVAEGIETTELMGKLEGMGCDEGQGYLFAQPMPLDAVEEYLTRS
ncbi:bifunctional diguanylate cyclase/phosphodiesterase [Herbaspirillum sp. SJZ107]|uniref:putative bifunctional diguanylate cyclase/phosphodiesterase n=1 Tax=Herbaspirillum sp. SJZ107 TaxID=2572881 RepID=UPI0016396977|nr:EAL domain-containing protein [Herbaspirillum sp. SJZ107]